MGTYTALRPKWDLTQRNDKGMRTLKVAISAQDITDGTLVVQTNMVGMDPLLFVQVYSATGVIQAAGAADTFVFDPATGDLTVTLGGVDYVATDVIHLMMVEAP